MYNSEHEWLENIFINKTSLKNELKRRSITFCDVSMLSKFLLMFITLLSYGSGQWLLYTYTAYTSSFSLKDVTTNMSQMAWNGFEMKLCKQKHNDPI